MRRPPQPRPHSWRQAPRRGAPPAFCSSRTRPALAVQRGHTGWYVLLVVHSRCDRCMVNMQRSGGCSAWPQHAKQTSASPHPAGDTAVRGERQRVRAAGGDGGRVRDALDGHRLCVDQVKPARPDLARVAAAPASVRAGGRRAGGPSLFAIFRRRRGESRAATLQPVPVRAQRSRQDRR